LTVHYFSFENSKYEIDFIIQNENDEIIPVEVKSGENLKARSFRLFCEKFQPPTAIRTSLSNYRKEDRLINIPMYIIGDFV
jgi:predicted AAA+ superfamily ATPase